jgi:hypothetical protein
MIYLIEYRRSAGRLLRLETFPDDARSAAEQARMKLEQEHRADSDYEVVLLDAESEAALRETHGRYFKDIKDLAAAA